MRAVMERVADADAPWIDARVRATWDALVLEIPRPGNPDPEVFERVHVAVAHNSATLRFRDHVVCHAFDAGYAHLYRRMDRSLLLTHIRDCILRFARFIVRKCETLVADDGPTVVLAPTLAFDGPLAHWLPRETIRDLADEMRMTRALVAMEKAV